MRRVECIAGSLLLCACLLVGPATAQTSDNARSTAERAAQSAATAWLALVDEGDFGESWDAAATVLQERIPRDRWQQEGRELRDSLQALSRRTVTMVQYRDSLRRAPDGPFVILTYRSSFEGGRVEEVLLTIREDATWTVAGYQVTPLPAAESRVSSPREEGTSP